MSQDFQVCWAVIETCLAHFPSLPFINGLGEWGWSRNPGQRGASSCNQGHSTTAKNLIFVGPFCMGWTHGLLDPSCGHNLDMFLSWVPIGIPMLGKPRIVSVCRKEEASRLDSPGICFFRAEFLGLSMSSYVSLYFRLPGSCHLSMVHQCLGPVATSRSDVRDDPSLLDSNDSLTDVLIHIG